ncbi:MAG: hypothetical protein R2704_08805 [Microthrixaceae bacterium]|nr:hypothetical protein [Microthrixaceae bacterium]
MTALVTPPTASSVGVGGAPVMRSLNYDRMLLVWLPSLAVGAATIAAAVPAATSAIILANLWLLGYHHVGATFTRFIGDPQLRADRRGLLTWLPVLVLALTVAAGVLIGQWLIATTYFYWQFFHYTRQSWGIEEAFRRKAGGEAPTQLMKAAFWAVPVAGVVWRSSQGADRFLNLPIRLLPVPTVVGWAALVVAAGVIAAWLATKPGLAGGAGPAFLTHVAIFGIGYVLMPEITVGWLVLNIWHNGQYVSFVWHTNNRSFGNAPDQVGAEPGVGRATAAMRWLSRSTRWPMYMAVSIVASGIAYFTLDLSLEAVGASVALVYMGINFHHYVVDGLIWKLRSPKLAANLGLPAESTAAAGPTPGV